MSIERSRNWNPGGGNWLEVLPCLAVSGPAPASGSASSYPLRPGFAWSRIYCTQETIGYSDDQTITDNGRVYDMAVIGFSPSDDAAKAAELEKLTGLGRVMVRFRDNARLTRVIGTPTEGLEFTYKLTTDTTVAGNRGYSLQMEAVITTPCRYE